MSATTPVPFVDLMAQMKAVRPEVEEDLVEILSTAAFVGGQFVDDFEREYADFVNAKHCVGVANGTDAIELALRATKIGVGDEVVLPVNTFVATAEAVVRAGAKPVFVDVCPQDLLMDARRIEEVLTSRTKAVIPVHLYGQMASMSEIMQVADRHGLTVVEDAAQAQGACLDGMYAGAYGHIAATSFYPGKNLGAAGDAGAVTTNSAELARCVRLLSNHGSERKYAHETLGFNSRLDAIQAAVLRRKLPHLQTWNRQRQEAAAHYRDLLGGVDGITLPMAHVVEGHVWHLYVVQVDNRQLVAERLRLEGVSTGIHYPQPIHRMPAFASAQLPNQGFPVAEAAADRILSLPMFPSITYDQQVRVCESLRRAVSTVRDG